ncbi:MAG: tol-pal system protein YbgF [Deltaproteobacteria bacterium CG11_big_fil_rev_8_21_14_0_20_47_16]|nr:MAG: tol-pal system protein YbgF [Deltaproteobacteria bacterium CG11_big_fil_rev_8_21_14_0_20_47_16]
MKPLIVLAACFVILAAPTAKADDISSLKQQVSALQQSLRSMQQAGMEKGIQTAEGAANVDKVRHEFQTLQGSFDSLQFKLQTLQESLDRYQQDTDSRLRTIEEQLQILHKQGGGTALIPPVVPGAPTAQLEGEGALYQRGLTFVRDADYNRGATVFKELLQKYPNGTFAGNSQYWLAECYYAQRDYQRAIKEYQTVITKYPRLDKIPSAKLKQGLAFADLGMTSEATLFLEKLVKDHPNTPEAHKAQDRLRYLTRKTPPSVEKKPIPSKDDIPLAPGVKKPSASRAPEPLNQSKASSADKY